MKLSTFLICLACLLAGTWAALPHPEPITNSSKIQITFGVILPKTLLITVARSYFKTLTESVEAFTLNRHVKYHFKDFYEISSPSGTSMSLNPSPTEILNVLCNKVVKRNVITILYFTNSKIFGSNAASVQYLLQLTAYLGIPVISWNADNIGVEQRVSESRILQLAPSMEHQAAAMLSILRRYSWHQFSIVTTLIGGHDHFIRAVRDLVLESTEFMFNILGVFVLKGNTKHELRGELEHMKRSDTRVILLYATKEEGIDIMSVATELGMTGKNYMWIASQSVAGSGTVHFAPDQFPMGMLAIHFNASTNVLENEMERAITIFFHGLELYVKNRRNHNQTLSHNLHCSGLGDTRWNHGDTFFRYLQRVNIETRKGQSDIQFNTDGTLKHVHLDVLNLNSRNVWERIANMCVCVCADDRY
ncbi:glutamate receptor ionotropic, NMDA 2B-like [Tachypleus tridentatus]|uniref:glutamate receptor ionotropic, NMDA 2B-like n=1 Tax=Tachypleus tridentatus TaxID=6853 RepID=UPI003FD5393E